MAGQMVLKTVVLSDQKMVATMVALWGYYLVVLMVVMMVVNMAGLMAEMMVGMMVAW
jgi:hypothetical protein